MRHRLQAGFIPPTLTGHPELGLSSKRPLAGRFFYALAQGSLSTAANEERDAITCVPARLLPDLHPLRRA